MLKSVRSATLLGLVAVGAARAQTSTYTRMVPASKWAPDSTLFAVSADSSADTSRFKWKTRALTLRNFRTFNDYGVHDSIATNGFRLATGKRATMSGSDTSAGLWRFIDTLVTPAGSSFTSGGYLAAAGKHWQWAANDTTLGTLFVKDTLKGQPVFANLQQHLKSDSATWADSAAVSDSAVAAGRSTKLTSARTLWGQSFDGTANVTGPITETGATTNSMAQTVSSQSTLGLSNTASGSVNATILTLSKSTAGAIAGYYLTADSAGTNKILIAMNGNVTNANNSYGAISDGRLKNWSAAAVPRSDLDFLRRVTFHDFTYKADGPKARSQFGVIAQEVLPLDSSLVTIGSDGFYTMNYMGLAVRAAHATQELVKIVDGQQAVIADLQRRIAALEAKVGKP